VPALLPLERSVAKGKLLVPALLLLEGSARKGKLLVPALLLLEGSAPNGKPLVPALVLAGRVPKGKLLMPALLLASGALKRELLVPALLLLLASGAPKGKLLATALLLLAGSALKGELLAAALLLMLPLALCASEGMPPAPRGSFMLTRAGKLSDDLFRPSSGAGIATAAELLPAIEAAVEVKASLFVVRATLGLPGVSGWPQPLSLWFLSVLANAALASLLL
jgi:hypothetical protein